MDYQVKRPPSVWLAQILLGLITLFWLVVIVATFTVMRHSGALFLPGLLMILGFLVLLLVSQWALARRKAYGRWLAVLSLTLHWASIVQAEVSRPEWPREPGHLVFVLILHTLLHVLFLTLIFRLAFARRVREFFRKELEPT